MAKSKVKNPKTRPVVWLHGEITTPPFAAEAKREAGYLLWRLQAGEKVKYPKNEPLPTVGPRCGALRVRDDKHSWRIMYRLDPDAVVVVEVYSKKTPKIPDEVISTCQKRLRAYDDAVKAAQQKKDNK